jgi:hypothetical protein
MTAIALSTAARSCCMLACRIAGLMRNLTVDMITVNSVNIMYSYAQYSICIRSKFISQAPC